MHLHPIDGMGTGLLQSVVNLSALRRTSAPSIVLETRRSIIGQVSADILLDAVDGRGAGSQAVPARDRRIDQNTPKNSTEHGVVAPSGNARRSVASSSPGQGPLPRLEESHGCCR
jgi:hypothetical protein